MLKSCPLEAQDLTLHSQPPLPCQSGVVNGLEAVDDPESTMSTVAHLLERLHASNSSSVEKETAMSDLLTLSREKREARILIGSHSQAMPLFISILRNGTPGAKVTVAAILSALCKEDDLRVKVLLGGCVPPLLSMLKSEYSKARIAAAEAIFEVSSGRLTDDHVGMKIFVMEGVVPTLWDLLSPKSRQDRAIEGFVTGALRNLCGEKDDYWKATLEAGGVEIIIGLLSSKNVASQSNAASLLARLVSAFSDSIQKIIDAGAVKELLHLLDQDNDISVRESASDALEALSSKSSVAKRAAVDAGCLPVLISAVVAPSKECMLGSTCHALQTHAVHALANICGSMTSLLLYLGELCQTSQLSSLSDTLGALAYSLMVFDASESRDFDPTILENILITLLKRKEISLVQDRLLEALASLYGNPCLSGRIFHSDAKKVLVSLITMASPDVQEKLVISLYRLCCDGAGIWNAINEKEGVQLLISLFGLSSEQHQEHAVCLLAILSDQVDESKWAITAAGGIPPLVQLLETGSQKAKEDAAHILWNLCCHSEDIRACVESAGAVSSLLWLLKSGSPEGQEASSKALRKLIKCADSATVNQLLVLLLSDSPTSKAHIITVLGHVLVMASREDLVQNGSPANKCLKSLVLALNSLSEETQEYAASALADIFCTRQDICDTLVTDDIIEPCMKLLTSSTQVIATQSARALGALSCTTYASSGNKVSCITEGDVQPLVKMAMMSSIDAAETAVAALANLLSDANIAKEALEEDICCALTRVLKEGSFIGKMNASRSLRHLLNHFPLSSVLADFSQLRYVIQSLLEVLASVDIKHETTADPMDVLSTIARTKLSIKFGAPPWTAFIDVSDDLHPLVHCVTIGPPPIQDKSIIILSTLCQQHASLIAAYVAKSQDCIVSLANRVMESTTMEVRIASMGLLLCALKHKEEAINVLNAIGSLSNLISSLVEISRQSTSPGCLDIDVWRPFSERTFDQDNSEVPDSARILGGTVAIFLLCVICASQVESKHIILDLGGVEIFSDMLATHASSSSANLDDDGNIWVISLLLAILFQDPVVVESSPILRIIPSIVSVLKSEDLTNRFFAAQALTSLTSAGVGGSHIAIANSGAIGGLITLVGHVESEMPNLVRMSEEFKLPNNPSQVALEALFNIENVRSGSTARRSIPMLVDLLRPMPDKLGAPLVALRLLRKLAEDNENNKVAMAEAGAVDALTKYLSLGPQDTTESMISELLGILYSNSELLNHESSLSALNQLIAVLRLGSRISRLSAVRTLQELFSSEYLRECEMAKQAVEPLVDMLDTGNKIEQQAAVVALIKLTAGNNTKAPILTDVEKNPLASLQKILANSSSVELKKDVAQLCCIVFGNPSMRVLPVAAECVLPLISLLSLESDHSVEPAVCALDRLLDEEQNASIAATSEVVGRLVSFISRENYQLSEASISALIKLGKDRPDCKLDMVNLGIIENAIDMLLDAPTSVSSVIAELLRILTNNSGIAKSSAAARTVEPLFLVLQRPDFSMWGQHSALQALVNILEKPQSLTTLRLTPSQVIQPLISFLESPSQAIQQLGTEVLSHLLEQEHFQQDITTKNAVVPLVQLTGIGILSLQQTAVRALESISMSWPKAVADAGGILELSKVIVQDDPQPSQALWESAALVLCNVLRQSSDHNVKVSITVLVKLLSSTVESTITVALNALLVQRKSSSSSVAMAQAGAIDAILELLKSHQCEESAGRLLEALLNNARVRDMKVAKYAIAPLSQYLLDPQTRNQSAKFLVTLALGDLFQREALARTSDAVSACRALVGLLEDQLTEEMTMVAVCALQNLVMHSRTNRRAVAEAGGVLVVQELLLSHNLDIAGQSALLIRYLFSNHTLQEYVSNELIRSLTAALEKELLSTSSTNGEVVRTIFVILTNFKKLRNSEAATLCIPHLVTTLSAGTEASQEAVLDTLCLLKESWPQMNEDIAKAQALTAAEAIPVLQSLMKTCPPSFHERADSLLHCLPGCLTVTIIRGNNLKQTMGSTNAFCCLQIGGGPVRQTKVVNHSACPEWNEGFTWAFDVPPKGQKLYIICKTKNTFGKSTLGRVTIQIDKVLTDGSYSGHISLSHDGGGKDGLRTLELEIIWSNRTSNECL